MELVLSRVRIGGENKNESPFENEEVREWSHVDRLTGMLEHARIETGRWQTSHEGTAQAYGKVIDSRERNSADGNVVQKARRQVEVFQSQGVGGRSVKVVRASQWSSSRITDSTSSSPVSVSMNDASSQLGNGNDDDCNSLAKLSRVSRLCRRINGGLISTNGGFDEKKSPHKSPNDDSMRSTKSPAVGSGLKELQDFGNHVRIGSGPMTNHSRSTSNEDLRKLTGIDSRAESSRGKIFARDCDSRRSLQLVQKSKEVLSGDEFAVKNTQTGTEIKKLKSYVLGMEEEEEEEGKFRNDGSVVRSLKPALNPPKTMIDQKFIFNGASDGTAEGLKDFTKSDYLRPTPILLKPIGTGNRSNKTVVHLNNKMFPLDSKKKIQPNSSEDDASVNESATNGPTKSPINRRVQSLADKFSNDHRIDSIKRSFDNNADRNAFPSSRIEGLINRSLSVISSENFADKKIVGDNSTVDDNVDNGYNINNNNSKPTKKVGFCKTEVHFAAESGKVNIVETDSKPPPSNRFRRRRRNSVVTNGGAPLIGQNKNLPIIHFGDTSYEKYIFGQSSSRSVLKDDRFIDIDKGEIKSSDEKNPTTVGVAVENDLSDLRKSIGDGDRLSSLGSGLSSKGKRREEGEDDDGGDKFIGKNLWGSRFGNILKSEPIVVKDDDKVERDDDDNDRDKGSTICDENFRDQIDETTTVIDHSFKGSHTTTVNLGANVITSKLQRHKTKEDNIDHNTAIDVTIDDELLESGLAAADEICFESNKILEKNIFEDKKLLKKNIEANVVTSDNENNKVLMNIVTTHEPILARVEDTRAKLHDDENKIAELFVDKKRMTTGDKKFDNVVTKETNNRNNEKSSSLKSSETSLKHDTKDHRCDNNKKIVKELPNESNCDPTYVNVFRSEEKNVDPIYENCRTDRKNNVDGKKYAKKNHLPKSVTESNSRNADAKSKSTNDRSSENEIKFSPKDRGELDDSKRYKKSSDSDVKPVTKSENNSVKRNNRADDDKTKNGKTKVKKTVRPPSPTSSVESINRVPVNEDVKDPSEIARPLHTKSTRSSRLRRVTTTGKESNERYSSSLSDKKKLTNERTSGLNTKTKNDREVSKTSNDFTRSKKPIEIVYETAVFNMKNEKLVKSSKTKESKTPRYINDLICGIRQNKRAPVDAKQVQKGRERGEEKEAEGEDVRVFSKRMNRKSMSPSNRHWK